MNAPVGGLRWPEFRKVIASHMETRYKKQDDHYVCLVCKSLVLTADGYVSMHDPMFSGCAGGGEVKCVALPYCPKCEGKPALVSTCVHDYEEVT